MKAKFIIRKALRGLVTAIAAAAFIMMLSESEEGFITWVNFASMGVLWLCTLLLADPQSKGTTDKTERQ